MLRLAIVDDHKIVRAGFREMLADELGIRVEFEAASGEEAFSVCATRPATCSCSIFHCRGKVASMCCARCASATNPLKVLVLSGFPEERPRADDPQRGQRLPVQGLRAR